MGQQRLSGHASGGPTTHLSLVYRWANGGSTEAYRWLAIVGPTAHLSLVYRWPTVGPTVASHRWANRGPPVASHRWPNGGPTEARWTRPQWATGGCHRWPISTRTVGPPLAHQSNAIWDKSALGCDLWCDLWCDLGCGGGLPGPGVGRLRPNGFSMSPF